MFAAIIIIIIINYLDCFHPPWLFDLIVHDRPIFIHGLVPCSHTNCILTQEKQREKTLQNCQFLHLGNFGPRTKAYLRAQGEPGLPQPLCQEPIIALYSADSGMNISRPESDSCLTTEILLLAFWKPLECARHGCGFLIINGNESWSYCTLPVLLILFVS